MPVSVIVGAQWGDEGKGKVTDFLAQDADVVARYQGGNNAGHTVVVDGVEHKLQLLPSGSVHERVRNIIGNGLVVDPGALLGELQKLHAKGIKPNVAVSDRAHVILPVHKLLDGAYEDKAGGGFGTTRKGIGPAYTDKAARVGVRMGDLLDATALRERIIARVAGEGQRRRYEEAAHGNGGQDRFHALLLTFLSRRTGNERSDHF